MPSHNYLNTISLTPRKELQTFVEHRRVFNLNNCELNIFESYEETYRVPLTFNDFVITSMMRGKKIVHLFDKPAFTYLPGETAIAAGNEPMVIDFPEASELNPTQCVALTIDSEYINDTLGYLNNHYNSDPDIEHNWKLQFNQYHFNNDAEITAIINKLIRICSSGDTAKNIYADLNLKELLIRLVQSQHLVQTASEASELSNRTRLHYILNYIQENLTGKIAVDTLSRKAYMSRNDFFKWFRQQFGITPLDYINNERIKLAKQLLVYNNQTVTEISYRCGFSDVNYFVRLFKKVEGITPKTYRDVSVMRVG